jgi:hypothetical protein
VHCDDRGDHLEISVEPENREDVALELYSASSRKDLLESVLGVPVELA